VSIFVDKFRRPPNHCAEAKIDRINKDIRSSAARLILNEYGKKILAQFGFGTHSANGQEESHGRATSLSFERVLRNKLVSYDRLKGVVSSYVCVAGHVVLRPCGGAYDYL
jgi:hypothetical protein